LRGLRRIGAGAHGMAYVDGEGLQVAKVGYANTGEIIDKECAVLRRLEAAGVPHVVRCGGTCLRDGRVIAVLFPYFPGKRQLSPPAVSSLGESARMDLLSRMAAFLVGCLAAGVAVADLQALVDAAGHVLFFDLTGAGLLDGPDGEALAGTFVGDWFSSLPADSQELAAEELVLELDRLAPGALPAAAAVALAEAPLAGDPSGTAARLQASAVRVAR